MLREWPCNYIVSKQTTLSSCARNYEFIFLTSAAFMLHTDITAFLTATALHILFVLVIGKHIRRISNHAMKVHAPLER